MRWAPLADDNAGVCRVRLVRRAAEGELASRIVEASHAVVVIGDLVVPLIPGLVKALLHGLRRVLAEAGDHCIVVAVPAIAREGASVPAEGVIAVALGQPEATAHAPAPGPPPVRAVSGAGGEALVRAAVDVGVGVPAILGHAHLPLRRVGAQRVILLALRGGVHRHLPGRGMGGRAGSQRALDRGLVEQRARATASGLARSRHPLGHGQGNQGPASLGVRRLQRAGEVGHAGAEGVAHRPLASAVQGEQGHGVCADSWASLDAERGCSLEHQAEGAAVAVPGARGPPHLLRRVRGLRSTLPAQLLAHGAGAGG
mmetsp:Transcript_14434/g.36981  ORF Transcript_14434/g.36981 Transcript_14434/m.36981 type:complete len:314 (+) Transcript_14434:494-1435(+)